MSRRPARFASAVSSRFPCLGCHGRLVRPCRCSTGGQAARGTPESGSEITSQWLPFGRSSFFSFFSPPFGWPPGGSGCGFAGGGGGVPAGRGGEGAGCGGIGCGFTGAGGGFP